MREILFKAKRIGDGKWIEGDLIKRVHYDEVTYYIGFIEMTSLSKAQVIPETVSQFTGLFDANGKRIFEGDIIEYEKRRLIVCFDYGSFGYLEETTIGDKRHSAVIPFNDYEGGISIDVEYHTFYKIIGNRFDNSDLLKGE